MSRQHLFCRAALSTLLLALCLGLLACSSQSTAEVHNDGPALPVGPVATATPTAPSSPVRPDRLLIPAIQVNAPIEAVGIDTNGNLATPRLSPWLDTGWYSSGPRPGAKGSSVIDGHLDRPGGYPAVFWLLRQLHIGDIVEVHESNNKTLRFRVIDIEYYQPQNAPLQQIFGNTSGKYLNLITCAGDWIASQNQTTLRLVVYTKLA